MFYISKVLSTEIKYTLTLHIITFKIHLVLIFIQNFLKKKKQHLRTQIEPGCLNNGQYDTRQTQAKSQQDEKRAFSLSDFLATVILKLDHVNINRENSTSHQPVGYDLGTLFLISHMSSQEML